MQEIWITGYTYSNNRNNPVIVVYRPNLHDWEFITPKIGEMGLYVHDLFLDSNNVIWGRTMLEREQKNSLDIDQSPVLSRFNENTQQFELAKGAPEVPLVKYNSRSETVVISDEGTRILLDNNDIFWIFVQKDGLYRYDPTTQITEQKAHLPAYILSAALSPDGSIYFSIYGNQEGRGLGPFIFQEGNLLRFIPQTGKVESLGKPDGTWPMFNGMIFDHQGKLWLGSIGYLEASGTWHLTHPKPEDYLANAEELSWQLPSPILASSDGRLWFKQYLDGERGQGTAWYDPQKEVGCWFTTYPANIVEDANQQIWMMGENGRLYKYALNSP